MALGLGIHPWQPEALLDARHGGWGQRHLDHLRCRAAKADDVRLPAAVAHAITDAQRTGPVRWCWLALSDQRLATGFLGFAKKKAEWMRAEAPPGSLRRAAG